MFMHSMHDTVDLDLLRAFDHLMRERHLTRAARRAGLSQPAMSRALGRLRTTFSDPLFVRTARGMVPTPRAEGLAPDVRALLDAARTLVQPPGFDPATLERTFTIASSDFLDASLLPRLSVTLEASAPNVSVATRPIAADTNDLIVNGQLDLIVGMRANIPADCIAVHLFDDGFVCLARKGHPRIGKSLTLKRFTDLHHVLIAPRGDPGGTVDRALERLGLRRQVMIRTASFLAAPLITAGSDLILTGPSRVLLPMAQAFDLVVLRPPVELSRFAIYLGWHPRVQQDPAHTWFRQACREAIRERDG